MRTSLGLNLCTRMQLLGTLPALFQLPIKQKGEEEGTNILMHGDKRGMDRISSGVERRIQRTTRMHRNLEASAIAITIAKRFLQQSSCELLRCKQRMNAPIVMDGWNYCSHSSSQCENTQCYNTQSYTKGLPKMLGMRVKYKKRVPDFDVYLV